MSIYPVLAALLDYPQQPLLDALDEIDAALAAHPDAARELAPLVGELRGRSLIESQEEYVATFDRNPRHSLHLFEHVHGESRDRGQAMVDLLAEYRRFGLEISTNELPDYVPLFLEVLGLIDADDASALLGEAVHVLAAIGKHLLDSGSAYASIFTVLCEMSAVTPEPLTVAPVRDMDEALEVFGVGEDGVEPLIMRSEVQPVHFHPRAERLNATARAKEMQ
ncbi:MAG: nitrate reductase molybdenum cofactor assembly chaperone [Paraburkholderia sp.]|uniref:nitrate reductase molybdenum cofactor assembly chaperone n=1 Tax=Paraburkholderia sp. TaxID=1926495 RepID=UPI00120BF408|nr:nitrate reductase molybdenum cofactor assembly chaperone [Paraburkholderia sp.]TAM00279.1 MAG: nitrate reductase molybdenum cofactor assembly chaperone [Paraburkholderia sp.]TAM31485.1 MAG: nitrate reductase molybdenum cofactor assembly chaperone [Paraburkholderia sp.]